LEVPGLRKLQFPIDFEPGWAAGGYSRRPFSTALKLNDLLAVVRRLASARSGYIGCACSRASGQDPHRVRNEAGTCSPRAFRDLLAFLDPQGRAPGTPAFQGRRERPGGSDSCFALPSLCGRAMQIARRRSLRPGDGARYFYLGIIDRNVGLKPRALRSAPAGSYRV
jgi:hypothetical protein